MPQIADITVKNAAGTDVIYVAATPSAGDTLPARWTQNALTSVQGFRPKLELTSRSNGNGDVRRIDFDFSYPFTYTDPSTSLPRLLATTRFTGSVANARVLTVDQWNEAFVQLGNLLVSTLIRNTVKDGFAPT